MTRAERAERGGPLPKVRAPKRRLSLQAERALTPRQLEILDELESSLFSEGFADVTMAEIARRMGCSLRTLYGIAPSKDELVLAVADRQLHRIGLEARRALEGDAPPLDRLRAYLRATNRALQPMTVAFSDDFNRIDGASGLADAHARCIVDITRALLDESVRAGEIGAVETGPIAAVLGRLGRDFSRPDLEEVAGGSPRETADALTDIFLLGLKARGATRSPHTRGGAPKRTARA